MNLDLFLRSKETSWRDLERATAAAKRKPHKLGAEGVLELGRLYRSASADLGLARRRWPGDPVVGHLEDLVGKARPLVYSTPSREDTLLGFFTHRYWARVAERPGLLALAWALMLAPAALAVVWALHDPAAASGVLPEEYRNVGSSSGGGIPESAGVRSVFSTFIFTNNISVTFKAFAGGALAGLGTAYILIYNGLILGVVAGLVFAAGGGESFVGLVAAHGFLELSCIAVVAAAGLRMGVALVDPGPLPRSDSFVRAAREGVEIALGTMPWLVLAGFIEGFFTPEDVGALTDVIVGLGLAGLFWGLVIVLGRRPIDEPGSST